jgi:tetratricopeptide (TPR) repeat protein
MKVPSNDLFELIQALTRGEKLFFRKNALHRKTAPGRGYLKLFDLLARSAVYDEPVLLEKLGYTGNRPAFAVLKNYLYNELMNALVQFYRQFNPAAQPVMQAQQLDILAEKGLLEQYMKCWRKCYKEAAANEQFQLMFILNEQLHHLKMNFIVKTNHTELKALINAGEDFSGEYGQLQQLKNFYLHVQLYNKQSQIRLKKQETSQVAAMLQNPLIEKLPEHCSFHYYYYFFMCRAVLYYLSHEYQSAYGILDNIKNQLIKNKHIAVTNPYLNIEFINVFYLVAFLCKEYDSFFAFLDQPLNKTFQSDNHKAFLFACRANSYLRYYVTQGQYDEATRHLARIEKDMPPHFAAIPLEMKQLLTGSMGISYFILGQYNDAFHRAKECMKTFHDHPREDIQRYIYPLCIVIAYEMKNLRLLVSECDNAYQFFYRKKMMTPFEESFISFFRKIPRVHGRKETREKFTAFREQLEIFRQDAVMGQVFRYFNFYGWAESKELGITYMEYVQQKRKNPA